MKRQELVNLRICKCICRKKKLPQKSSSLSFSFKIHVIIKNVTCPCTTQALFNGTYIHIHTNNFTFTLLYYFREIRRKNQHVRKLKSLPANFQHQFLRIRFEKNDFSLNSLKLSRCTRVKDGAQSIAHLRVERDRFKRGGFDFCEFDRMEGEKKVKYRV